jgi:hypothetical protein
MEMVLGMELVLEMVSGVLRAMEMVLAMGLVLEMALEVLRATGMVLATAEEKAVA